MAVEYEEVSERGRRRFHIAWPELAKLVGVPDGSVVEVNSTNIGLWFTVLEPKDAPESG